MNIDDLTTQMERNAATIGHIVGGVSDAQAAWKPDSTAWSILEVVNHLYDEERYDFRARLDVMLHRPDDPLPPFDPKGLVEAGRYNEHDLGESLRRFTDERRASITWLRSLESPDWNAPYREPHRTMTAGDMLASWIAHDILHLRQLVKLQWLLTVRELAPYKVDYAGPW